MPLEWSAITSIVLYVVAFPFYIYAFLKWFEWRKHFLFGLRRSYEALFIVFILLIACHVNLVRTITDDFISIDVVSYQRIRGCIFSLWWIVFLFLYYKTNLIFLSWKQNQLRLTLNTNAGTTESPKHWTSIFLLCFTFIGAILNYICWTLYFWTAAASIWGLNILICILLMINIKVNKVMDLLSCLHEFYITISSILLWFIIVFLTANNQNIMRLSGAFYSHILALFILYFTIYLIRKYKINDGTMGMIHLYKANSVDPESISGGNCDIGGIPKLDTIASRRTSLHDITKKKQSITDFLCTKQNYDLFSRYLALCLCLENLLFVEKVSILRWNVMNIKNNQILTMLEESPRIRMYEMMEYGFLKVKYKEYIDNITNKITLLRKKEQVSFNDNIRDFIFNLYVDVYNEFICDTSINQINIPYDSRLALQNQLKTNINMQQYQSFDDFLSLFDGVMIDICALLIGVYSFRFVEYIRKLEQNQ